MPASGAGATHTKRFLSIMKSSPADMPVIHSTLVSKKSMTDLQKENGRKIKQKTQH